MAYFIKVSLAWTLFLLLFELVFRHNGKFTANRLYLVLSLLAGLVIPLIPMPCAIAWDIGWARVPAMQQYMAPSGSSAVQTGLATNMSTHTIAASPIARQTLWSWLPIAIYLAGAGFLFIRYLSEAVKIILLIRRSNTLCVDGHKVIVTGKCHSPYSFMSYTFLPAIEGMPADELAYILQHETAHQQRSHCFDLWALQLINVLLWFHPLVWRYRYLLQMQHEYEADAIAARENPYGYGSFLLQQSLLGGVPAISHSFHFSPIKNRIKMLTKINNAPSGGRKYLLLVPALLACSFIMAKSAVTEKPEIPGNKMSVDGKMFTWRASDTLYFDRNSGKAEVVPINAQVKQQVITGIDNEPVYNNDHVQQAAAYGNASTAFADYVKDRFQELRKNTSDSMTYLVDLNIVVDKQGKVVYHKANFAHAEQASQQSGVMNLFQDWGTRAEIMLNQILADSPAWKPAMQHGEAVNSFVHVRFPGC